MVVEVAARLGNTPAVCRRSYVHPGVVDAFVSSTHRDLRCGSVARGADDRRRSLGAGVSAAIVT